MEEKGSSSSSSSRWNPTKEQIAILEGLYKQGVRTPTAEQIQQITARLQEFGGTEGKNIFYWFQNHKARQRQKLKQERFAYYSRILNHGPVPMPMPATTVTHLPPHAHGCSNVVCGPYCMPVPQVGNVGFYQQQQTQYPNHVFMPRSMQMMSSAQDQAQRTDLRYNAEQRDLEAIQTLQLFPLHPTGILEAERSAGSSLTSASMESHERVEEGDEGGKDNKPPPFFNFFRN